MTEVCDALHDSLLTCDESLIHRVTPDIMALCISKLKSGKAMEIKVLHLIIYIILVSVYISYCHYYLSLYYSMDILHMNCSYAALYLSPKMLNHHYALLIIIEEYLYSILLQKCLIMLLLNYLVAVCKLLICNLFIKQNILQHYAPWFILRLCIIMLTLVVTFIAVYYMHQRHLIESIMENFLLFYYQNKYLPLLFVIYWIVIFAKCHVHCGTQVALTIFQCLTG